MSRTGSTPKRRGNALLDDLDQPRHGNLRIVGGHEIEIRLGARLRQLRRLTGIDPMRVLHDLALGGLPEHLRQSNDRDGAAGDDVGKRLAWTDRGQLIDVADEEHGGSIVDRLHQGVHQDDIDHGGLVDDEKIAGKRIVLVAPEAAGLRIGLQQAMDGLGFDGRSFPSSAWPRGP